MTMGMSKIFKVVNVVAVMNCGFNLDMKKIWNSEYLLYASDGEKGATYTGIKPPEATKQITVFYNGNMITLGNKSVEEARNNLNIAKRWLKNFMLKEAQNASNNNKR